MRRKKNLLIITLCLILLVMGIGYSAFQSKLEINSSSTVTSNWDIEITNVAFKSKVGYAEEVASSFDKTSANVSASFTSPGDTIVYDVTVSNKGSINAVLDYIKIKMSEQDIIHFKIDGINSNEVIKKGEEKTFTLTMTYNENITSQPNITSTDFNMDLSFLQEGNSSNFNTSNSLSDTLSINKIDLSSTETSIRSNVSATKAIKYYYSIDNDKWYESENNTYEIFNLSPYKDYTIYIKAEDIEGNVVFGSNMIKTKDETPPTLEFTLDGTLGNNNIYKGLNINVKALDNDKINSIKYCIDSQTCTPASDLTLTNNVGTVSLSSSTSDQVLCVTATDPKGNTTSKCTDAFKVDTEVPKITNMSLTPNEDTMTIVVDASDTYSEIDKYYFSKDNGTTYVESTSGNYTFTSLDEGDYLVTVYVTDKAGNKSEISAKTTTIRYTTFCKQNGINNLSDCVIATEAGNADINEAKTLIKGKGTPDFNVTSPTVNYTQTVATTTSTLSRTSPDLWIGDGYTFNASAGTYAITNGKATDPETLDFSNGQVYYTNNSNWNSTTVTNIYKITNVTTTTNSTTGMKTYTMTVTSYGKAVSSYDTTGVGMYAATDDQGDTYYYRGSVSGNYVKMADKYWRIVRVNGDGTLRMIYDGTTGHENGETSRNRQIGTSTFNSYINDNTYVGYMYADPNNFTITDSETGTYGQSSLSPTALYYFSDSYTFDKATRSFKLSGNIFSGTIGTDKVGYYTFFSTNKDATSQRLLYTTKYNSSTIMTVKGYGYGTNSLEEAQTNATDSSMKTYLDKWYNNNLTSYDSIISKDAVFCNNRTIYPKKSGTYQNEGYGNHPTIEGYQRLWDWVDKKTGPELSCPANDSFSVTSTNGNGKLSKSIGLLTADEVNMAGGITGSSNMLYYLYIGTYWWTMSPSFFYGWFDADEFGVSAAGDLVVGGVWNGRGVRPVINIDTTKAIFTGIGTKEDPYVLTSI